jgi:hypothetical protein
MEKENKGGRKSNIATYEERIPEALEMKRLSRNNSVGTLTYLLGPELTTIKGWNGRP